ncbi:MAG TPA: response regulator [Chloroflexota bacterium]|nr:response regulator [Chloroflexota bacterium]HUM67364.1 response regulator [Chloroflexota bacterium]
MWENVSFLYVEDDLRSRQVMELIITKAMKASNLVIFEDSANFTPRIKAATKQPDVFLLDIHIKPHDGFAMLRMIREGLDLQKARVIALTASVMNEEVEKMRARGFDGAISKPLSVSLFPGLMARIVAGEAVWHIA